MAQPDEILVVILAAGHGKRLASQSQICPTAPKPGAKALAAVAGRPMLAHVLDVVHNHKCLVVGRERDHEVKALVSTRGAQFVIQDQANGTAGAVAAALQARPDFRGIVIVLFGDMPLVRPDIIDALVEPLHPPVGIVMSVIRIDYPQGYGRVRLDKDGFIADIIEERDADAATRSIDLCNAGAMAFQSEDYRALADGLTKSRVTGELYLTALPSLAAASGIKTVPVTRSAVEMTGVNTLTDLAEAERQFQQARLRQLSVDGVFCHDLKRVWLDSSSEVRPGATLEPDVHIGADVVIEAGAHVRSFSYLEGCLIGAGAVIGPSARIRPTTTIGAQVHIGHYVEIKNATIGKRSKINHLSYIGDCTIGEGVNIGAGTITCNYDGVSKSVTVIEDDAFIGSNTSLIAPVRIGTRAVIGAGSVISRDVVSNALALTRAEPRIIPDWARHKARLSGSNKKT